MSFGKRGVSAARLAHATAAPTPAAASGVVEPKPTAYDARRRDALLAKAATDATDAQYLKLAVIGCVVVVALMGLYTLGTMYLGRAA
jgi:hypothetical protein